MLLGRYSDVQTVNQSEPPQAIPERAPFKDKKIPATFCCNLQKKEEEARIGRYVLQTHTAIAVQCDGFALAAICGALGFGHGESYRLPDLLVLIHVMDGLKLFENKYHNIGNLSNTQAASIECGSALKFTPYVIKKRETTCYGPHLLLLRGRRLRLPEVVLVNKLPH
jgi:hypothetical protein